MNIPGGSGLQFQQFTPISGHKTRVNNTVNLYSYLKACGNIMFTLGPNNNLWLTEATGTDTNGCDMLNDSRFAFFGTIGAVMGPHGGKIKNWRFRSYGIFGDFGIPQRWIMSCQQKTAC